MQNHPQPANPGVIRPPLVYGLAVAAGLVFESFAPLTLNFGGLTTPLSGLFFGGGIALFIWARAAFQKAGTPIPGNRPTTALVQQGPFRFTRNPIYLAFSALQVSAAIWLGTFWIMVTLLGALLIMSAVVIPREERFMKLRFGAAYDAYASQTRRWL